MKYRIVKVETEEYRLQKYVPQEGWSFISDCYSCVGDAKIALDKLCHKAPTRDKVISVVMEQNEEKPVGGQTSFTKIQPKDDLADKIAKIAKQIHQKYTEI